MFKLDWVIYCRKWKIYIIYNYINRLIINLHRAAYIHISQNFSITLETQFWSSLAIAEKWFWSSPLFLFNDIRLDTSIYFPIDPWVKILILKLKIHNFSGILGIKNVVSLESLSFWDVKNWKKWGVHHDRREIIGLFP